MNGRWVTVAAALGGAADTTVFLATRPKLFATAPQRAGGSVAFLAGWVALATAAARDARTGRRSATTVALSQLLLAGNAAMLAVHLKNHISNPRVFLGAGLSAAAAAGAFLA
ncbi:MAG: hypothetical protein JOZ75_05165 [Candidatus Dormibacteraeota bacterium]|nr:hypothetical protein [Candidatus Dormibacteraeota bacterium]